MANHIQGIMNHIQGTMYVEKRPSRGQAPRLEDGFGSAIHWAPVLVGASRVLSVGATDLRSASNLPRMTLASRNRAHRTAFGLLLWASLSLVSHAQIQLEKHEPTEGCGFDCAYGFSVSMDEEFAVVSSPALGTVYTYAVTRAGLVDAGQIDTGKFTWGVSTAVKANVVAAGFPSDAVLGQFHAGSVSLYRRSNGIWEFAQLLKADVPAAEAGFGFAIEMVENSIIVSAPFVVNGNCRESFGAVYVFDRIGTGWRQVQIISPASCGTTGYFGRALAANENVLVIGQASVGGAGGGPGTAHILVRRNGRWERTQILSAPISSPGDEFGASGIAVGAGTIMICGLVPADRQFKSGVVHVFASGESGWEYDQSLTPSDISPVYLHFGRGIAIAGETAIMSGGYDSDLGQTSGSAYHFRKSGEGWTQVGKILANDGSENDDLAYSGVAVVDNHVLIGAPGEDGVNPQNYEGAAYLFELSTSAVQYCSCPLGAACGNGDDHGGCRNSMGQGGVLSAAASGSVSADELIFQARWLPQSVHGIVFMGSSESQLPFGDGLLCVGASDGSLYRFGPKASGRDGSIRYGPGIVAYTQANFPPAGQIQAGDTWYFQTWYRDSSGPCGTGFNLTNGLKVEFTP